MLTRNDGQLKFWNGKIVDKIEYTNVFIEIKKDS